MNVLVIGSGGREHALCWKIKQSSRIGNLFCAPGNGGTAQDAVNIDLDVTEHKNVIGFCKDKEIDLVVVGPEAPLAVGITDHLEAEGIKVFGPSYAASRMESSKIFAKELMGRYDIPTAGFRVFDDLEKTKSYLSSSNFPVVVKAYGLAAGKGVIIAETQGEAEAAAEDMLVTKVFGPAGNKIIIEEFLVGEEVSLLVVTDGINAIPLATSQDHKCIHDGDKGPNTGGMGAYSPAPVMNEELLKEVMQTIVHPTLGGLTKEEILYKGVLFFGLILTASGPKLLEYNVRFGDPETQVVLPRLKSDLLDLLVATAEGDISGITLDWEEEACVCVVLAAGGYPAAYEKGKRIEGVDAAASEGAIVFHAGTKIEENELLTSGGRVLGVAGKGKNIQEATKKAYKAVEKIHFDGMQYRKDIGHRALSRV